LLVTPPQPHRPPYTTLFRSGLEDAEANVEADPDHDDREPERHAPSPVEKLVARYRAESQHRQIRQKQPGRAAPLRPGGDKAAMRSEEHTSELQSRVELVCRL